MGNQRNSLLSEATAAERLAVYLYPGREKPVINHHPWIFRGSIATIPDEAADGAIVDVRAADGAWLGCGYLNRASQITIRLLSWQREEAIDSTFWRKRLQTAIDLRQRLFANQATNAYRLINAESDFLPGLTVDRYDSHLIMQVGTLGIEQRKVDLAEMLLALTGCEGVFERSAMAVRQHEGLGECTGVLAGSAPPQPITIYEQGLQFQVDLLRGQKTGFFTDQRENRQRVATYCRGQRVLNAFSYTGAFAIYALAAGAQQVVNLDSSMDALILAEANLRLNGFDPDVQTENIAGDAFTILRDWRQTADPANLFDVIVLDPPKFAQNKRHINQALRGYKEINLSAMQLLKPGGILATFSCSGLVGVNEFYGAVFHAAADVGRPLQVLEWLRQANDHPVVTSFPEGDYLKGLICRVV